MIRRALAALALTLLPLAGQAACGAVVGDAAMAKGIDAFRAAAGLRGLAVSDRLNQAAAAHACDMAGRGFFDHRGSDGSDITRRVRRTGYRACFFAENIAWGYPDAARVLAGWKDSPGHRRNLLARKAREAGIARADGGGRRYWVLVLAAPC